RAAPPTPTMAGVLPESALPARPRAAATTALPEPALPVCIGVADFGRWYGELEHPRQVIDYIDVNGDKVTTAAYQLADSSSAAAMHSIERDFRRHWERANGRTGLVGGPRVLTGLPPSQFGYQVISGGEHDGFHPHDVVQQIFAVKDQHIIQ